jgi:nucleotide-binding universal stress UspA family protein
MTYNIICQGRDKSSRILLICTQTANREVNSKVVSVLNMLIRHEHPKEVRVMYKRILLPLDGSPLAEQALPHAIAIAECFQSELVLLRVLVPLPRPPTTAEAALQRAEQAVAVFVHEYMESVATGVREHGITVQAIAIEGIPHFQITQYAETNQVDLIVMCSRGQTGLSRWMIGSVSDRVMRGANVPVLLVRAQKKEM